MDLNESTVRWGIGLAGALVVAAIAVLFLDGTMRLLVLGIAVVDAVATPLILKQAAESEGEDADETEYAR